MKQPSTEWSKSCYWGTLHDPADGEHVLAAGLHPNRPFVLSACETLESLEFSGE